MGSFYFKMNKKGQVLEQLGTLSIGIVTLAILLVISFLIMAEANTVNDDLIDTTTTLGETITYSNGVFVALTFSPNAIPDSVTCLAVMNNTDVIGSGNYTCDNRGLNLVGTVWNATVQVNYTHQQADQAWNATSTLRNATEDIPGWVPLIVIAVIGALLLGLVRLFTDRK
jgi:hypothetical protein